MNLAKCRERARALAEPIASSHLVVVDDLFGPCKYARVAAARHELFVSLFRDGFSIADVARITEKDHTTVIAGMKKALGDDVYDAELSRRYPNGKGAPRRIGRAAA